MRCASAPRRNSNSGRTTSSPSSSAARPRRGRAILTGAGMPVKRVYGPQDLPESYEDIGLPGQFPYTRGPYPTMYRGRKWTMRQIAGFGQAGGDQQALPVPDRPGPDRSVGGLRHAHADGSRQRRRDESRRGRSRGRGDRRAARHGGPLRRHRPGEHLGVDDDQPVGVDPARDVRRGRRGPRHGPQQAVGDDSERHPQRVCRAEGMGLPRPPEHAHRARLHRLRRRAHGPVQPGQHQRVPHQRGRRQRPAGGRLHDGDHQGLRARTSSTPATTSTASRRGCRSSSSPRRTSSRRSRSSVPSAATTRR